MLKDLQAQVAPWHRARWPTATVDGMGNKLAEEVGEACAAIIERWAPSRAGRNSHSLADELGDVVIVCAALAEKAGLDLEDCVRLRWGQVQQR